LSIKITAMFAESTTQNALAAKPASGCVRSNHAGNLRLTYCGCQEHYTAQVQVDWGYGSLFGERDLMLHQMSNYPLHWLAQTGSRAYLTADEASKLYSEAMDYSIGPRFYFRPTRMQP
jgi:hypothetical protein